jgi:ATP-dependent Clp protease ATP-binding subunit ClpA
LKLTDDARRVLGARGYVPAYGARPLKRLITKEIENPLARRILAGDFGEGDTVIVDTHEQAFTFRKE